MAYTTIKKPSDYFNTKLYSGDGNTTQAITGVGFQPDFTWLKNRSDGTGWHRLSDGVRGVTKILYSNATNAEVTTDANGYIASFDSDGLTVNLGSSGTGTGTNSSGDNFVTWNWLADNTNGSSNTDGSITSTVSANTTSGFSIVKWDGNETAGASVGHGLGVVPDLIIKKRAMASTGYWYVYSSQLGNNKSIYLNDTSAAETSGAWNNQTPTSSVFYNGSSNVENGIDMITYCFASKQGFSKFGSYVGNGNANGPFIYTGFKPSWVMIKTDLAGEEWRIWDSTRGLYNLMGPTLVANSSAAEGTFNGIDFLSNGFKIRSASSALNYNATKHIYMAFAEEPLVGDNPATAR